jgi:membrane-associated phospholipid phosphatase
MMRGLSALGDTALLAPASLALFLYLAALRRWPDARALAATRVVGLGATLVAKLLFKACGGTLSFFDIMSPSGHASFASLFYGALAIMVAAGRPRWQGALLGGAAAALVLAIGASRAALDAHSWPEVLLGWLIGLLGLAVFVLLRRPRAERPLSLLPLAAGLAFAIVVVDGRHVSPENLIGRIARSARASLDICVPAPVTGLKPSSGIVPL